MRIPKSLATVFATLAPLVLFVILFASSTPAQGGAWMIVRAEYGFRAQRADVTGIVKDLISSGGVNGFVAVNNQTMGGDPAPGADKILRIFARNSNSQEQEFDYGEGAFIPANMFFVQPPDRDAFSRDDRDHGDDADSHRDDADNLRDDADNHRDDRDQFAGRDRDDSNRVSVALAFWGAQRRMVDVTDLLQHMVRNGALTVTANNASMGLDPAPGAGKILIVVYRYRGRQQAAAASEGHLLSLP